MVSPDASLRLHGEWPCFPRGLLARVISFSDSRRRVLVSRFVPISSTNGLRRGPRHLDGTRGWLTMWSPTDRSSLFGRPISSGRSPVIPSKTSGRNGGLGPRRRPVHVFWRTSVQTQQPKQREDWRRRREKYLRESDRRVELIKEGYECEDSSKNWAVIVGGCEHGALERHALGARLFLVRTDVPASTSGEMRDHGRPIGQASTRLAARASSFFPREK